MRIAHFRGLTMLVTALAALAPGFATAGEPLRGVDPPPNVLLLIADDLGVGDVGVYTTGPNAVPGTPPPTPNIDGLAASGVLFREAWSAPVCSPTRAALVTGRYGFRTGVRDVGGELPLSESTFAELLSPAGYANGLFGKWHLGESAAVGGDDAPRVSGGWDYFAGTLGGGIGDYFVYDQVTNGVTATVNNYATTETVDDALAWIGAQTGPWTCTVSFNAPHKPFHIPPPDLTTYTFGPNPTDVRMYRAMIEAMDTEIGRLLAGLGGSLSNTVVIFLGDNGTPAMVTQSPYTTSKGSIYEGGVHVPLVIRAPGIDTPGREVLTPVHVCDLFTTIADYGGVDAGAALPGVTIDGLSLRGLLEDQNATLPRSTIYTERAGAVAADGLFAIRGDQYNLIQQAGVFELYDLVNDPFETDDLLDPPGGLTQGEQDAYDALVAALEALREDLCTADLNADGSVDISDLGSQLANFGATSGASKADGDVTGDGAVDISDLGALLAEFGQSCW